MTAGDVIRAIDAVAPAESAQEWDNVGLQVGTAAAPVGAVLVCLEVTDAVLDEAEAEGAELIVAHHPLIFRPLGAVLTDRPVGRMVQRLLCAGRALFVAHTNLDAAPEIGTAAALGGLLGLREATALLPDEGGLGLIGEIADVPTVAALAERVRAALNPARLTVVGRLDRQVRRVALMPGSGGDAVGPAAEGGADALVCGDLTHHDALEALALGLSVIDAGHYATERPVVGSIAHYLRSCVGERVRVIESAVVTDPFSGGPT